jgi:ribonucleases P/MRP protein subunit RPP40
LISLTATMLDFLGEKDARPDSKIFTTLGTLPSFIDRSQPPTKKQPWRAINEIGFVRSIEIVLPDELYDMIRRKVEEELKPVKYARVIMKLEDLLDGEFFTEYIKKGKQYGTFVGFCSTLLFYPFQFEAET